MVLDADLAAALARSEDSSCQFKADAHNVDALASELAAFANAQGGTLYLGVDDAGRAIGLTPDDVRRLNQLISNAATQHVRSPLVVQTRNHPVGDGRIVIAVHVPEGFDKPYFDRNGVIWLKVASDKRRIHTKEELRRMFQASDQIHADELPVHAGLAELDRARLRTFLETTHGEPLPDDDADLLRTLCNLNLARPDGRLTLAGLLLFGTHPERVRPAFVVKAIALPTTTLLADAADEVADMTGALRQVYDDTLAFLRRNLRQPPAGPGINAPGHTEIPLAALEELLVNALVHRDYLIEGPVRVFVFADRIEITSPGHLPNHLTVANIRAGNAVLRNPILASFVARGLLPYRGLGSGVRRALLAWPSTRLVDDRDGNTFTVILPRPGHPTPT